MAARFAFGRNWKRFLEHLSPAQVEASKEALSALLGSRDLTGRTFLDVGSGSGLSSLAARDLGANVVSFDYDEECVACTRTLRENRDASDPNWRVERGSVLDDDFLRSLGPFDIVHAWGVLHHTGDLKRSMENVDLNVGPGGTLVVAIYNDQGWRSRAWRLLKRSYVTGPTALRPLLIALTAAIIWVPRLAYDTLRGHPLARWRSYHERGMSAWTDLVDWAGGYPYEVASVREVVDFYAARGYVTQTVEPATSGCNQFAFEKRALAGS